jgi:NitT/TauT family transport system permease protein
MEMVETRERDLLEKELRDSRREARRSHRRVLTGQALLLIVFLVTWSFVSGRWVDELFLSNPWNVARAFWGSLVGGSLWYHLQYTLSEMFLGYVLGATTGLFAAALVSSVRWGEPILRPFALAGMATPKIALAPVIIVWFGIGVFPKVLLAASMVFFIVYFNTLAGIASVGPGLVSTMRVMNASRAALLTKAILPGASPFIMMSLRITLPAALIGAIIGELMSSNRGVGYLISAASTRYNTAEVFAGIFTLLTFVLLLNSLLSVAERHLFRWRPSKKGLLSSG